MRQRGSQSLWIFAAMCGLALSFSPPARAQSGPVYPDDSVQAHEGLGRVQELAAAGNAAEGVRVLQSLLESEGDHVLVSDADPDLFVSVRARVHELLLSDRTLLERYRAAEESKAADLLQKGRHAEVERSRFLTRSGFEACLRVAQSLLERGQFHAARITLKQLDTHPDRRADPRAGADAAGLAALLTRYLSRDDLRDMATRWAAEAGVGAPRADAFQLPSQPPPIMPMGVLAPAELQGLVKRPIQTAWLSEEARANAEFEAQRSLRDDNRAWFLRSLRDEAWPVPALLGDRLLLNDGQSVSCLDRFTLQPLWSFTPELTLDAGDAGPRQSRRHAPRPGDGRGHHQRGGGRGRRGRRHRLCRRRTARGRPAPLRLRRGVRTTPLVRQPAGDGRAAGPGNRARPDRPLRGRRGRPHAQDRVVETRRQRALGRARPLHGRAALGPHARQRRLGRRPAVHQGRGRHQHPRRRRLQVRRAGRAGRGGGRQRARRVGAPPGFRAVRRARREPPSLGRRQAAGRRRSVHHAHARARLDHPRGSRHRRDRLAPSRGRAGRPALPGRGRRLARRGLAGPRGVR
jgi:hypothetical protein